jgi:EAL domain-containing protein (putative c-di-GMP-specific phosphodiesterase class I)
MSIRLGTIQGGFRRIQLPVVSISLQPVLETQRREVFAFKSVVTGPSGEDYKTLTAEMTLKEQVVLERFVIAKTFHIASEDRARWIGSKLAVDLTADAADAHECLDYVSQMTQRFDLEPDQVLLEINGDRDIDPFSLRRLVFAAREAGFGAVIRDYDEICAGTNVTPACGSEFLKLTGNLIRKIHESPRRQEVIWGMVSRCSSMDIQIVADQVSMMEEFSVLSRLGVSLMRGSLLCANGDGVFLAPVFPLRSLQPVSAVPYFGLGKVGWAG